MLIIERFRGCWVVLRFDDWVGTEELYLPDYLPHAFCLTPFSNIARILCERSFILKGF